MAENSVRIPTVLCYDVEDLIAPESDEVALWLAEILTEHGLTGSFMVVGEKARLWEQRGRQDIIEAFKRHHLGFHSTWHSVHPTTTEICLETNFAAGMEALWKWDREGWADIERIMGRPMPGWARTGASWSPSVMGLMGRMGRAYIYSLVRLPGHNVCWYANCLGFHGAGIGAFDADYSDDNAMERKLQAMSAEIEEYAQGERHPAEWLGIFVCHPTAIISTDFWDAVNFAKGANPPRSEWKSAPQRPKELLPTMQGNYRKLCRFVREDSRLEVVGWGDLIQRFSGQKPFASHAELKEIAQRIADEREVLFTDDFTAGEILLLLCRSLTTPAEQYVRPTVFGPLTTPSAGKTGPFAITDILAAARTIENIARSGYLPASVALGRNMISIGTLFIAIAEAVLGHTAVSGPSDAPYPHAAEAVAREVAHNLPDWVIHPPDMDMANLLEQTRLQCWTIKPAIG